jgi:hypothetical protein
MVNFITDILCLFCYRSLNDTVSIWGSIASNDKMNSQLWIREDMAGSDPGIFLEGLWKIVENMSEDSRSLVRDLNSGDSEYRRLWPLSRITSTFNSWFISNTSKFCGLKLDYFVIIASTYLTYKLLLILSVLQSYQLVFYVWDKAANACERCVPVSLGSSTASLRGFPRLQTHSTSLISTVF